MSQQAILQAVEQSQITSNHPQIQVGDTVDVHYRIIEGDKQRIQVFAGVIIKMQGKGVTATFTVRRIVANEGVERTFPLYSPKIAKIEIKRNAHVRRSRLYYLRERVGKSRRLRDKRRGLASAEVQEESKPQPAAAPAGDEAAESGEE